MFTCTDGANNHGRFFAVPLLTLCLTTVAANAGNTFVDPFPRVVVVAHRGCMVECPENTIAAFAWADQAGADMIELDVRASADGELVVLHDQTVDRTTNGTGSVHALLLADIKHLDAGDGQSLPTLHEVLAFAREGNLKLLLDIKGGDRINPARLVHALRTFELTQSVIIGTRSLEMQQSYNEVDPSILTLAFTGDTGLIGAYIRQGADIVRLWPNWMRDHPGLIDEIQSLGTQVWVTTGELRGADLKKITSRGIDGVITDYPREALDFVSASGNSRQ